MGARWLAVPISHDSLPNGFTACQPALPRMHFEKKDKIG
jgi:hypothetical protein